MQTMEEYRKAFVSYLEKATVVKEPNNLYNPIKYILGLGGKRLRPVLTLMTTEVFGEDYKKALDVAMAIEMFHNFSLVHDDIMDGAPLRRGQKTVHEKWDTNTGILSGDAMLIQAYQFLEAYEDPVFKKLTTLFSTTAGQVCEGQQYDVDFETRSDVTIAGYLKMIEYKTAVLVGAAMKMGAIVAHASIAHQEGIYQFGIHLGLAFQIQDDYLDVFGNPKTFGKQLGGDIIENKKTFLYLKALEKADHEQTLELGHLFSIQPKDPADKIASIRELYMESGAAQATKNEIGNYTQKAFSILEGLDIAENKKHLLKVFGNSLMDREA